jgi:hypothetical protein
MTENNKQKDGINEGTKIKAQLQLRAIEFLKSYPQNKTLDSYARLLCWDLHTTYRTALDSYIMPMYEHNYFVYNGDDKFSFKNGKENKQIKKSKIEKEEIDKTKMEDESVEEYFKRTGQTTGSD